MHPINPVYDGFQQGWENSLTCGPSHYTEPDLTRLARELYTSYEEGNHEQSEADFISEFSAGWQAGQAYFRREEGPYMSDIPPIRILAQPESPEQAAQMISHHTAGAYELIGGAVLGFQLEAGMELWPFAWPEARGVAAVTAAHTAHEYPDGSARKDIEIEAAWTCLLFDSPYSTAIARVTITFRGLADTYEFAFWIDARKHQRLQAASAKAMAVNSKIIWNVRHFW